VRTLSDAALAKISAALKARWAKSKRAAKKEARNAAAAAAAKKTTPKGRVRKKPSATNAVPVNKASQPQTKTPVTPAS